MTVRAKMQCHEVTSFQGGNIRVRLGAVYSNDPNSENRAFADATPQGSVEMHIQGNKPAAKMFEAGKHYYVDFTEAPAT
jgi:hypothetical protein